MPNPILEQMGQRPNIGNIIDMMRSKSPQEAVEAMCNANPSFRSFYETNKDKPIDDVCRSYGINPSALRQMLR